MQAIYNAIMNRSGPVLRHVLETRCRNGKEDRDRLGERMGHASRSRPAGKLVWFHAASVGEAQSTFVLINALLLRHPGLRVLVTTGTVNSAALLEWRLPPEAVHQYYPLDHPAWVGAFLDHWRPDLVLWMESELWPAMLSGITSRGIPAALINARLSARSLRRWRFFRPFVRRLLSTFNPILAQTKLDSAHLHGLGAINIEVTDNLKYSATPLPCDPDTLAALQNATEGRPLWIYASSHNGEEALACRVHARLQSLFPTLLTIIVPRHPERRGEIVQTATVSGLKAQLRSADGNSAAGCQVYIADTMGELGLFYRLCPVACIGRSFSADGGGGHNPIEAALLGCAVLHGPNAQNLGSIYAEMGRAGAALEAHNENDLFEKLRQLLQDPAALKMQQEKSLQFAKDKERVLDKVLVYLRPVLEAALT